MYVFSCGLCWPGGLEFLGLSPSLAYLILPANLKTASGFPTSPLYVFHLFQFQNVIEEKIQIINIK